MDINGRNFAIIRGPSKDRLIDAFKYAYGTDTNVPIDFNIAFSLTNGTENPSSKLDAKDWIVFEISHEDGSGHSFNLAGYVAIKTSTEYEHYNFSAYYNANSRTGSISFKKH